MRGLDHRLPIERADVVDQNIEPPKSLDHRIHKKLYLRRVGNIRFDRKAFRSCSLHFAQSILRRGFVRTIRNRHARPGLRQSHRDSFADSAASAANQRCPLPKSQFPIPFRFRTRKYKGNPLAALVASLVSVRVQTRHNYGHIVGLLVRAAPLFRRIDQFLGDSSGRSGAMPQDFLQQSP